MASKRFELDKADVKKSWKGLIYGIAATAIDQILQSPDLIETTVKAVVPEPFNHIIGSGIILGIIRLGKNFIDDHT